MRRRPLAVAAIVLTGMIAIGAASLSEAAHVSLQQAVDAHWRGAYDILVRPAGTRLDLEDTNGLVEPNFVGFSGTGGISLAQLSAIRGIAGVEVAAPISMLGYLAGQPLAPTIYISPDQLPERPTLYEVRLRVETNDGRGPMLVQDETVDVLLGPVDLRSLDSFQQLAATTGSLSGGEEGVDLGLSALEPFVSPLMAVDPVAEQSLLGAAGAFVEPLAEVPRQGRDAVGFDRGLIPDPYAFSRLRLDLAAGGPPEAQARPVVPLVVSRRTYAPLNLSLTVTQVGQPLDAWPEDGTPLERLAAAEATAGAGRRNLGTNVVDLSEAARPFEPPTLAIGWLDSALPTVFGSATRGVADLNAELAARPIYFAADAPPGSPAGGLAVAITPVGSTGATAPARASGIGIRRGVEQDYRRLTAYPLALEQGFVPQVAFDSPFLFAPVGEYDLGEVDLPVDPLTYVPLGAYDPSQTTLVADARGSDLASPVPLHPTLNPAGLIAVPPLGITDLQSATLLRGSAPIDAIRVRVAGLAGYDAAGRARVEGVASEIAALGLDVDIVAGSSPQAVRIFVPDYDLNSDPPGDLGWVAQGWTTLGATSRVERALSAANVALLGLALATVTTFLVGIGLVSAGVRQHETMVLRSLGWSDQRIIGRQVAEVLPGGFAVAVVGIAAGIAARGAAVAIGVALLAAVLVPAVVAIGAWFATRRARPGPRPSDFSPRLFFRGTVVSPLGYAVRQVFGYRLRAGVALVSIALVGGAGGVGLGLLVGRATEAGPTRLADYLTGILDLPQWALVGLAALSGVVLTVLIGRLELRARAGELAALRSVGWRPQQIANVLRLERLLRAAVAAALALPLAALLAAAVGTSSVPIILAAAVALALSSAAWAAPGLRQPLTRRPSG